MTPFKIVRKIGKMLRGGAGRKEIFLGALLGVLIGFNPTASLTLALTILIALLLNANIGFTLLGMALGKLLSLAIAAISFHTGYFLIHNIGLEGLFTTLTNTPVTALMDLDVYAMVGGLPYAIIIGIAFGKMMAAVVTKIREQMVRAGENEKVGKMAGNKFAKFLMWLVFGKQKVSTADVLAKQSPLFRKSGILLVAVVLIVGLVLEFFLLDLAVKRGLQTAIQNETGAEVDIDKAHLSLAGGMLELEGLQVADPEKLTHNLVQIDTLAADVSVIDLLRNTYTVDLLSGSTLRRDVERAAPAKLLAKDVEDAAAPKEDVAKDAEGKSIDEYLTQAKALGKYGQKAYGYLKQRKDNAEAIQQGEKPKVPKTAAVADAKKFGYLKARADLVANRPAWTIRKVEIDNVQLGGDIPAQRLEASEVSSHPEFNGQPTIFTLTPTGATEPAARLVLRFDDPAAQHQITANLKGIAIGDSIRTPDSLKIEDGTADISFDGKFSADALDIPFTLNVRNLKTNNDTINALKNIQLPGKLYGTLLSPRIKVDLGDRLKDAVVGAAKEKAREEAKKAAQEEIDKAMQSEDAQEIKSKAKDALKGLF
jgi:uncharacterized protein (TIGR03546 family)